MSCFCEGSPEATYMIIGMAPGKEELVKDTPFIGPSGRLLWSLAKTAGIDRADCYLVNTIGEWPAGKDGNPTPEQYDTWWDRFDSAVGLFRGRVAIPLGGAALWRSTGLAGGIENWRGYLVGRDEFRLLERHALVAVPYKRDNKKKGIKAGDVRYKKAKVAAAPPESSATLYVPALHPAGVLRTGNATAPLLKGDLIKAARAATGTLRPSRSSWMPTAMVLTRTPVLSVDIETGDKTSGFRDITRVAVANDVTAWTAPWNADTRATLREQLATSDSEIVMHNMAFDKPRLESVGIAFSPKVRDTMFAAALLQPDLKKGLNAVGSMYMDCHRWKHLSDSEPAKYNALDAVRTHELWLAEKALLQETGQLRLFTDTIMPGLQVLIDMGELGIKVDPERRATWLQTLQAEGAALHRQWIDLVGPVNFGSPYQIKKLFHDRGMYIPFNKHGKESADKQAMRRLADENPSEAPLIELLVRLKRVYKDIATYAGIAIDSDNLVHPHFAPSFKDEDGLGKGLAGTWRPTANSPNLQNQPPAARNMYVPRIGYCFVVGDWGQLEARILAGYSGDSVLMAACDNDIHATNMARLNLDRVRAKNGFYGWGYLAGARTLQFTFRGAGMKVAQEECQALLDSFDSEYKIAAGHRQRMLAEFRAKGYVENGFGMRRYFPHSSFPAPAAMSTYIQSTGAFMLWDTLPAHAAEASRLGGRAILTVHDDVMWEVPIEHKDAACVAIKEVMTKEFPQVAPGFRVPVTVKWSPTSWGAMEAVNNV